ncbi:MAG: DUF177 domain-containing protein [Cardiobacteriaceae bacterium]|nr:DUF177 domain-containing protein [Cardiobacteriaceae bacterium]
MNRVFSKEQLENFDVWGFCKNNDIIGCQVALTDTRELSKFAHQDGVLSIELASQKNANIFAGQETFELNFHISTILDLQCQRCLENLAWHYEQEFSLPIFRSEKQAENAPETVEDFLVCEQAEKIDLLWFIEEEILLAMPMIAKHENCSLPQAFGKEKNNLAEEKENPFAALKQLLK